MISEIVISANSRQGISYWRELWRSRELLFFLTWRDIIVRYKQAALGIAWSVLKPLLTTLVFTLVFGKIAQLSSGDIPYLLLVLSGMTPWFYFANTVNDSGNSLVSNSTLISKVYFPRLVVPICGALVNLLDFLIAIVMLGLMLVWYGVGLGWHILAMPFVLLTLAMLSIGTGLWVAALNAKYRDVSFIMPFIISFGLYISPIGFSSATIPEKWRALYSLNPMVGVIDGFRYAIFGNRYPFEYWTLAFSFLIAFLLVVTGIAYFRSVEREIVDVL